MARCVHVLWWVISRNTDRRLGSVLILRHPPSATTSAVSCASRSPHGFTRTVSLNRTYAYFFRPCLPLLPYKVSDIEGLCALKISPYHSWESTTRFLCLEVLRIRLLYLSPFWLHLLLPFDWGFGMLAIVHLQRYDPQLIIKWDQNLSFDRHLDLIDRSCKNWALD